MSKHHSEVNPAVTIQQKNNAALEESQPEKHQLDLPLKKRRKLPEKKVIPDEQDLGFASKTIINCSFPQLQPKNPDGLSLLIGKEKTAIQS